MLSLRKRADKSGAEPAAGEAWPLASVELVGDAPKEHNFADTFVARASQEGYLEFENPRVVSTEVDGVSYSRNPIVTGDVIVLHLAGGDLRYKVLEHPGRYADEAAIAEGATVRESHEYRCRLIKGGTSG